MTNGYTTYHHIYYCIAQYVFQSFYMICVLTHDQPFKHTVVALFYGTDALTRHSVPVPVELGIHTHNHINDFATHHWIPYLESAVIPLFHNRFRFSHFPSLKQCALGPLRMI